MNNEKKNASIEYILSQGLVKPQTARGRVAEMIRIMGLRNIFWDTGYGLFFAAVTFAVVFVIFAATPGEYRRSASVTAAPLLFLLTAVFAETSQRVCGLYELKQTCRYTIRQTTAVRVICYSVAGAVSAAVIAVLGAKGAHEFLSLFTLCLSALFVCSTLSLAILRFIRAKWANAVFSAAWVFANTALTVSLNKVWEAALGGVPAVISAVVAVIGAASFVYQISKMLSEVERNAVAQ